MPHNLPPAENHPGRPARPLMPPVVLSHSDDASGVPPAGEVEDAEVDILFEYDPYTGGHAVH